MAELNFKMSEDDLKEFLYDEDAERPGSQVPVLPAELEDKEIAANEDVQTSETIGDKVTEAPGYIECSKKEAAFINVYLGHFNATRAAMETLNPKDEKSASVLGARLVKKFNLKKYNKESIKLKPVDTVSSQDHGKVQAVCQDASHGFMTMRELRKVLEDIARYDKNAAAQVSAARVLMEMALRARELAQTRSMADVAIEDLLAKALSQISKDVYIRTLAKARVIRTEFRRRCNDKFSEERVAQITADAKRAMLNGGGVDQYDPKQEEK
jgi:hypothetical protein